MRLLTLADISVGTSISVVIGVILTGVISAVVVIHTMRPSDRGDAEERRVALDNRNLALRRIAAIYAPISFVSLAVVLIAGGSTSVVLSGMNAAIGITAVILTRRRAP